MTTQEWKDLPDLQSVAQAQADGWEIETNTPTLNYPWVTWPGENWNSFHIYRGRPKQPKTKQVKMLCWYDGALNWYGENDVLPQDTWKRVPSEDKVIEVEE